MVAISQNHLKVRAFSTLTTLQQSVSDTGFKMLR